MNITRLLQAVNGAPRGVSLIGGNALETTGLQLDGATSGSITQLANSTTTPYTVTWPAAQGAASSFLENDGAGNLSWNTSVGSFANQQLSNLSGTVAVNLSLNPGTDNSISLGSSTKSYASGNIHTLKDGSAVLSVDTYNRLLADSAGVTSVDWQNRTLKDSSGATQLTWSTSGVATNAFSATTGSFTGAVNMNSNKITSLANGTAGGDAVNYGQLLALAAGITWKDAVTVATTAALPAYTWASGAGGADTLTGNSTGTLTVDGHLTALNDRILVKNETGSPNSAYNGIYLVTTAGAVGVAYVLTRATDMQTWSQVPGAVVVAQTGTVNADSGFVCTSAPGGTLDTTAITFSEFGYFLADGSTLQLVGNTFSVKNAGITEVQIAASSFLSTGAISGGSGTKISANVDNSTIDINGSNQLEVKAAGITATQLASASVTAAKLATVTDGVTTDQNGSGSTIEVLASPAVKFTAIAGQTFTANTSYAVRWGLTANGETAGRIYAADTTTSSFELYYVIGMISGGAGLSAGSSVTVTRSGPFSLSSADTAFASNTDGAAVFLSASGAFSVTAPSAAGTAVTRVGVVKTRSATVASNVIDVMPQTVMVN